MHQLKPGRIKVDAVEDARLPLRYGQESSPNSPPHTAIRRQLANVARARRWRSGRAGDDAPRSLCKLLG
eukprot:1434329-Prymnesium_polylepis.1